MELKKYSAGSFTPTQSARRGVLENDGFRAVGGSMSRISQEISDARDQDDFHAGQLSFVKGLNELDKQFEQDEDLATLSERRAEKTRALAESLYEGKSSWVQEKLREHFDMALESDGVKWDNFVMKKDSARRVAAFQGDQDQYLNHMIQAPDGAAYENAKTMWAGRLESIRPFMSVGEFGRIQEQAGDLVKFKRAFNRLDGQGEFDPGQYDDLRPEQVSQLEARHYAIARENERLVRERQVDRANAIMPRLEDSLASAMNEGVPMDGTNQMLAELSTLGEKGAELASRYQGEFARSARAWSVMDTVKTKPFAEQLAAVEGLRPEPGSDGYQADMTIYQRTGKMVMDRAKSFMADPAGYVRQDAERRARAAADPWVKDEDLEPAIIRASMDLQQELGETQPKLMSVPQAKGLKDQFERADGEGKAHILQGLQGFGEYQRKALNELGLGYEHTFAAELFMDDEILGRRVLDVMSTKEADLGVSPETAKDIRKQVEDAYYGEAGQFFQQQYNLTGNPEYLTMNKRMLDMAVKFGLATGDGDAAVKSLWGDRFNFVQEDDVSIYVPKDVDADEVAERLRSYRYYLPPEQAPFRNGIWKPAPDGTGYVLALPTGEVMNSGGKPVVVTMDDLEAVAGKLAIDMDKENAWQVDQFRKSVLGGMHEEGN